MRWIPDAAIDRLRSADSAPDLASTKYELEERIGRGGMGAVYLAADTQLGRRVALKVLDAPDRAGELAARLIQEAKILARLEHPGIVPIHDAGELSDGRLFYAMKYVDGERLDRYAAAGHSMPDRLRVFARVCEAVAFAHSRGILHRDLKPQNIMVGAFGEVLVMDWGVAKVLAGVGDPEEVDPEATAEGSSAGVVGAPGATEHGAVLGTPGYMAPEQARGEVGRLDARADVFSLGAVLRHLLDGQPPASELETLALGEPEPPLPAARPRLPRRLTAIVDKAMATDRRDRYESAIELARDVERFLDGQPVSALPESLWTRGRRFVGKHRVAFLLILAYVVTRALVLLFSGAQAPFSFW